MQHRLDLFRRAGRGCRENRRGAMPGVTTVGSLHRTGGSIHVISPVATVDVNVHKARTNESLPCIHLHTGFRQRDILFAPNGTDATMAADDNAIVDQAVREDNSAV